MATINPAIDPRFQSHRWLPLESNPDVMNEFAKNLGLDTSKFGYHDVYGFDPDLLMMVPRPVAAVLLLFPMTDESEKHMEEEADRIAKEGQKVSDGVFYMRQTIGNACGTIGMIHSVGNAADRLPLKEGSFFSRFVDETKGMSHEERGRFLEEHKDLEEAHSVAAQAGDTAAPPLEEKINLHFICFSCVDGCLYELDGRKKTPVNHGPSSPDTLLEDSVKVVQAFMSRTNSISFNMIALASNE